MRKERESTATIRKAWKRGERTQKMVTFRCDLENVEWLESRENKGRYINELIAKDRKEKGL